MAGLIQQQMGASANDEAMEQEPVEGKGPDGSAQHEGMEGEQPEAGDTSENNPDYKAALTLAYEALYKGEAAKDVAKQLKAAPSPAQGMADVTYNITQVVNDRVNDAVPDELLGVLAMNILEQVGEIAEAAGLNPQPEDIAEAFKTMLLRFLDEQGVDTTQLKQAMDQVDPSVFRQAANS